MVTRNAEDYLLSIYMLTQDGSAAKTTDIAARMKVSPASVTEMVKRLSDEGLVSYERYRGARLTERGSRHARKLRRKHCLLEKFLVDVLGMKRDVGHEEACRLEHVMSDESVSKICQLMNNPAECPKGEEIPPCVEICALCDKEPSTSMADLIEGEEGTITHLICERPGKVRKLISMGFVPGRKVTIEQVLPLGGPLLIRLEGTKIALAREFASLVHVKREA